MDFMIHQKTGKTIATVGHKLKSVTISYKLFDDKHLHPAKDDQFYLAKCSQG
jgi:hypothetical protein